MIQSLDSIPLFQNLSAAELQTVSAAAHTRSVPADSYLFMQGDPAEHVFVLLQGKIKLTRLTPDGRQLILHYIGPVEAFGVLAVLQDAESPVAAQAVEDSRVYAWGKSDMLRLMEQQPRLALNALRILADRTREFQDRLVELATERVERRIARTLIRLARQTGRKTPDGVLIDMVLTRQDLAELSGTTLFTVSRTLTRWESQGIVRSQRERVWIVFPHGLVRIAEDLQPADGPTAGTDFTGSI